MIHATANAKPRKVRVRAGRSPAAAAAGARLTRTASRATAPGWRTGAVVIGASGPSGRTVGFSATESEDRVEQALPNAARHETSSSARRTIDRRGRTTRDRIGLV